MVAMLFNPFASLFYKLVITLDNFLRPEVMVNAILGGRWMQRRWYLDVY